jgi:peptidyl-prolyl cis-trans isomerase C
MRLNSGVAEGEKSFSFCNPWLRCNTVTRTARKRLPFSKLRLVRDPEYPYPESALTSEAVKRRTREWVGVVVHEPFFQFIVLGLLIWGGVEYWNGYNTRYTIDLGSVERERIARGYLQQYGQLPTRHQLQSLVDRHIREEIFLRESLALSLDKDDEIVRRRLVQKYEFLQTDLAVPDSPGAGVLERWFEQNKLHYLTPERVAFSQVYFSIGKEGEEAVKIRALNVLKEVQETHTSRAPGLGDAFPGPSDVGALAPEEATRLFGKSQLSEQLFKLPVGQWAGPYRSGYGWHLIYVTGLTPPVLPTLAEMHERVLADYLDQQRQTLSERAFEKLRAKYRVRYDDVGDQVIPAKPSLIPDQSGTE